MMVVRNWTKPPNPVPLEDVNFALAEHIIYHVDADRKLTGATLKMSSGNDIKVDAGAAVIIFRATGDNDFKTREFLGEVQAPNQEPPREEIPHSWTTRAWPLLALVAFAFLLWLVLTK